MIPQVALKKPSGLPLIKIQMRCSQTIYNELHKLHMKVEGEEQSFQKPPRNPIKNLLHVHFNNNIRRLELIRQELQEHYEPKSHSLWFPILTKMSIIQVKSNWRGLVFYNQQ